jgi:hypothetical protein
MVLTFSLAVLLGLCAPRTAGAFLAAPPLRPPSSYFFPSPSLRAVSQPTELPDSYEQSLEWMASDALTALDKGVSLLRIDFDTSGGDETYTSLKQSLPMVQALLSSMAQEAVEKWTPSGGAAFSGDLEQSPTLRVFFPDQGTAALLERDWKVGLWSLVPLAADILCDFPVYSFIRRWGRMRPSSLTVSGSAV